MIRTIAVALLWFATSARAGGLDGGSLGGDVPLVIQPLTTTSSPTFGGLTLSGMSSGSVIFSTTSGQLSQDNANFFYQTGTPRLGLGTASPATKLHMSSGTLTLDGNVSPSVSANAQILVTGAATPFAAAGSQEHNVNLLYTGSWQWDLMTAANSAGTNGALFSIRNNAGTKSLNIDGANNNVGISNTAPAYALDVTGALRASGQGIISGTMTVSGAAFSVNGSTLNVISGGGVGINVAAANTTKLKIQGDDTGSTNSGLNVTDSAGSSKLFVRNDGNIGIGTTVPAYPLDIVGPSGIQLRGGTSNTQGFMAANNTLDVVFGSLTNSKLTLKTNNTTALTIDTSQNTGLGGLTTPAYALDITGALQTSGQAILGSSVTFKNASIQLTAGSTIAANGSLSISTAASVGATGSAALIVQSGGNVGIGTNNPSFLLDVGGTLRTTGSVTLGALAANWNVNNFRFSNVGGGVAGTADIQNGAGAGYGIFFPTSDGATAFTNAGVEIMRIGNSSNRVGIGTASPSTKLHMSSGTLTVDGNVDPKVKIANGASATAPPLVFGAGTYGIGAGNGASGLAIFDTTNGMDYDLTPGKILVAAAFALDTNGANEQFAIGGSEKMRLTATGLGIGNTAPATKLHLSSGTLTIDGNQSVAEILTGHSDWTGVAITTGAGCGTSPTIQTGSTDMAGKITLGSSPGASCVINFVNNFTQAPACFCNNETTANLARATTTTSALTCAGTLTASDVISYMCMGRR